jgi:RimJ/RimL family protein N-acetyltransferase
MVDEIGKLIIETPRLRIHLATEHDAPLVHQLWTDARVMKNVGFPNGLKITLEEVRADILGRGDSEFMQLLIVRLKDTWESIGQCVMRLPDDEGISETDVKLLPLYWGHRFGVEIKRALVDYLFTNTECAAVQGTPNEANVASIKMQEAVGGVRVNEGVYEFPEEMRKFTSPVHFYTYRVFRENWLRAKTGG